MLLLLDWMVTLSIFLIIVAQLLFGAPFSSPVDRQARITTSRLIRDCPVVALTTVIQFVQKLIQFLGKLDFFVRLLCLAHVIFVTSFFCILVTLVAWFCLFFKFLSSPSCFAIWVLFKKVNKHRRWFWSS